MEKTFKFFHYISFVQYPFLALALFFAYRPIFKGIDTMIEDFNNGLLFMGIAMSFASLADIRKRTKLGDRIYGKVKNAKRWVIYVISVVILLFGIAIFLHFISSNEEIKQLSTGVFVLGIGMVGMLRMNLEIIKSYQQNPAKIAD